jgi:hypothetical protein
MGLSGPNTGHQPLFYLCSSDDGHARSRGGRVVSLLFCSPPRFGPRPNTKKTLYVDRPAQKQLGKVRKDQVPIRQELDRRKGVSLGLDPPFLFHCGRCFFLALPKRVAR